MCVALPPRDNCARLVRLISAGLLWYAVIIIIMFMSDCHPLFAHIVFASRAEFTECLCLGTDPQLIEDNYLLGWLDMLINVSGDHLIDFRLNILID